MHGAAAGWYVQSNWSIYMEEICIFSRNMSCEDAVVFQYGKEGIKKY